MSDYSNVTQTFREAVLKRLTEFDDSSKAHEFTYKYDTFEGFDVAKNELVELNVEAEDDANAQHFTVLALADFNMREEAKHFFKENQGKLPAFISWLEENGLVKSCDKTFYVDKDKEPYIF